MIQSNTSGMEDGINQISDVISNVNELVVRIATAVEEQSMTMKEVSGNITDISQGILGTDAKVAQSASTTGAITTDIIELDKKNSQTASDSSQLNDCADSLSKLADQIMELGKQFKV